MALVRAILRSSGSLGHMVPDLVGGRGCAPRAGISVRLLALFTAEEERVIAAAGQVGGQIWGWLWRQAAAWWGEPRSWPRAKAP
jgi:hypothetical protein